MIWVIGGARDIVYEELELNGRVWLGRKKYCVGFVDIESIWQAIDLVSACQKKRYDCMIPWHCGTDPKNIY